MNAPKLRGVSELRRMLRFRGLIPALSHGIPTAEERIGGRSAG